MKVFEEVVKFMMYCSWSMVAIFNTFSLFNISINRIEAIVWFFIGILMGGVIWRSWYAVRK